MQVQRPMHAVCGEMERKELHEKGISSIGVRAGRAGNNGSAVAMVVPRAVERKGNRRDPSPSHVT